MSEPVNLRPAYSAAIVPMLTELLRRAQAGEIAQVALVHLHVDGVNYGVWISDRKEGPVDRHGTLALVGAVADLQDTLLRLHNQQQ